LQGDAQKPCNTNEEGMRKMYSLTDPYNLPVPVNLKDTVDTMYVYLQISSLAGVNNFPFDCSPKLDIEITSTPDIELGL
jgi:hypothetical protein